MDWTELAHHAWEARNHAYAPYSQFKVGAALQTKSGAIFVGCNVENLSFGLTNCAERVAIGNAIASGQREFEQIVVVADTEKPISPCGACRQVLAEFGVQRIVLIGKHGSEEFTLEQLLPRASTGILDRES
ncbi:cytidine deaminase [Luteolibacter pohnpeiensis]|uniref:Cytidine deaminase n=1 Tax=Luteolibacter pohnpeiensis TaxID=454153 RepID=A0A934S6Y6_9BACT|nr:cytidine deaminase [Luteolibacter pohnpeiensis]MBK1882329.1 cytidine deaminase [Luteolibacter pohnpeiensis]